MTINVPSGFNMAPVSTIKPEHVAEREWLIPRDTAFKVDKKFIDKDTGITHLHVTVQKPKIKKT